MWTLERLLTLFYLKEAVIMSLVLLSLRRGASWNSDTIALESKSFLDSSEFSAVSHELAS